MVSSKQQGISYIIKGLEGKDGNPPTSAALIRAISYLQSLKDEPEEPQNIKLAIKLAPSPPRGPEDHARDKAIMDENDMAHQVADCQYQDGSVLVAWQGTEDEGTQKAEVGAYRTLGAALQSCPLALPVCFDCDPQLAENGRDTQHGVDCSFSDDGCESALSP